MTAKKLPPDNPEQSKRFAETARELEVEKSGKSFSKALGKIVPVKKDKKRV